MAAVTGLDLARYDAHEDKRIKREVDAMKDIVVALNSLNGVLASINAHLFTLSSSVQKISGFVEAFEEEVNNVDD